MSLFPEDARFYVRQEFESRHARNRSYSWRSYARDLKISPSMLSEFLKGRYGLSRGKAQSVAENLNLDSSHTEHFIDLLESDFHRAPGQRELARLRANTRIKNPATYLRAETLKEILDWTYFALLEVVGLENGKVKRENFLKPFSKFFNKAESAIEKLKALGLIKEALPSDEITVAHDQLPNAEIDALNIQCLELAKTALTEIPASEREAISVFASLRAEDFPEFRRELGDVFLQLLNKYSTKDGTDSVYASSFQIFPVYKQGKNSQKT